MPPFLFRGVRLRTIRFAVGALALLVALQGIASGVLATRGPLHTHRSDASVVVVLEDVRRAPLQVEPALRQAAARHGHSHGDDMALRHHHRHGDASVAPAGGETLQSPDIADAGTGTALGSLLAIVSSVVAWLPGAIVEGPATSLAWVPQTHLPELPERPPRSA